MMLKLLLVASLTLLSSAWRGCVSQTYDSPEGYNLNNPVKMDVPKDLKEISGIAFYQKNPNPYYAIEDEHGIIYCYYPSYKNLIKTEFKSKGDFEDLAIAKDRVFALESHGSIYSFPFRLVGQKNVSEDSLIAQVNYLPKAEYESMYIDENDSKMYVLCKKRSGESRNQKGYILKIGSDGHVYRNSIFYIKNAEIENKLGFTITAFHPSALAKNNVTNEWYILSNYNKMLVVTNSKWHVKAVFPLNPKVFAQPEGIAFDSTNNLYISNEANNGMSQNILMFNYLKKSTNTTASVEKKFF
jgi:hypothetical protein